MYVVTSRRDPSSSSVDDETVSDPDSVTLPTAPGARASTPCTCSLESIASVAFIFGPITKLAVLARGVLAFWNDTTLAVLLTKRVPSAVAPNAVSEAFASQRAMSIGAVMLSV